MQNFTSNVINNNYFILIYNALYQLTYCELVIPWFESIGMKVRANQYYTNSVSPKFRKINTVSLKYFSSNAMLLLKYSYHIHIFFLIYHINI